MDIVRGLVALAVVFGAAILVFTVTDSVIVAFVVTLLVAPLPGLLVRRRGRD